MFVFAGGNPSTQDLNRVKINRRIHIKYTKDKKDPVTNLSHCRFLIDDPNDLSLTHVVKPTEDNIILGTRYYCSTNWLYNLPAIYGMRYFDLATNFAIVKVNNNQNQPILILIYDHDFINEIIKIDGQNIYLGDEFRVPEGMKIQIDGQNVIYLRGEFIDPKTWAFKSKNNKWLRPTSAPSERVRVNLIGEVHEKVHGIDATARRASGFGPRVKLSIPRAKIVDGRRFVATSSPRDIMADGEHQLS